MSKSNELSKKQNRELVELLIGGSQEAFGELYARFKKPLMYLCKQYMRNDADAEDIVHDIFLKVWETRHFLNPELSFSGYIQTVTENYVRDKLRHFDVHSRFAKNVLMNTQESTNETEASIIDNDYTELVNKLIERLPPKQKEIFQLNRIEGLTYNEISKLLQIPVGNVRRYASIASKKIKDQLSKHLDIHIQVVITILMSF